LTSVNKFEMTYGRLTSLK